MNFRRVLIALSLALLVSGACTWLVSRRIEAAPASATIQEVRYAAPSRALQAGEELNSNNTELVAWPESIPVDGAFSRTIDLAGRSTLFPLAKGQPILDRDLAVAGTGSGLANRIPDGMRAVALRSDEVVGVAGFLVPGSHLDVLVTYRPDGAAEPLTTTVVQNVVAIAAGHQTEPDPSGKTADVAVVTLLLTPEQSQRAVLASTQGAIHFVLRNGADSANETNDPVVLSQLALQPAAYARRVPRLQVQIARPNPPRHEIETILAGDAHTQSAADGGAGQ